MLGLLALAQFEVRKMICKICGKKAEYNEKLNIYYCKEHGFTTWIEDENIELEEMKVNAPQEIVLG